jgi:hypothetical protein
MKNVHFLPGVLVALVFSVYGAPTIQQKAYPGVQKVRMSDIEEWVAKGTYGDLAKINAIEEALTYCHNQLAGSKGSLSPKIQYSQTKESLKSPSKTEKACVEFVEFVHQNAPKGAHLHIHFNAILPAEQVWKLAIGQSLLKDPTYNTATSGKGTKIVQVGGAAQLKGKGTGDAPITESNQVDISDKLFKQLYLAPDFSESLEVRGEK